MTPKLTVVSSRKTESARETVLEVIGIEKGFRVKGVLLPVLGGVSFEASAGELICIIGRSGCGKSTLLKILAGFVPPDAGTARICGKPISRPGADRCVVFQEDALFPWLTVRENIAFGLKRKSGFGRGRAFEEVDRFLSLISLSEFADYLPSELSGGMKQRVALARVLILQPQVLLMDEPFASLDAQSRDEMHSLLLSLRRQFFHTILFVTHDVGEAVALADRILVMGKGPGRIREEILVSPGFPREREAGESTKLIRRLHEALRSRGDAGAP